VIIHMARVRILGPRDKLPDVLRVVQDVGLLHLAPAAAGTPILPVELTPLQQRQHRNLGRILADIDATVALLGCREPKRRSELQVTGSPSRWARLAHASRLRAEKLSARLTALEEEQALLQKYQLFFDVFEGLLSKADVPQQVKVYPLVLRDGQLQHAQLLKQQLTVLLGGGFELRERELPEGQVAVLLLVPAFSADRVDHLLAQGRIQEVSLPSGYTGGLSDAIPQMRRRAEAIALERETLRRDLAQLAASRCSALLGARAALRDSVARFEALPLTGGTQLAFVLEGWLPADSRRSLAIRLERDVGKTIVLEELTREQWAADDAPVVLSNPRLFRPFELIVRLLPLPRYGSLDPTPFVAVFFPMFFGLIMGDVGYGILLAALGVGLRLRSRPGTALRSVAEIAGPCAAFSVIFGFLYGELFGDLGQHWLGMRPWFNREEAVIPFLGLAVALGLVHVLLGLGLGVVSALRGHPRIALGRGLTALMIVLIVICLLAALEILPATLFSPAAIALLVAFPALVLVEGIVAPVELLSTLGNILSYARIMALGTASVMLAVVANRMAGALGSTLVGVMFALLFHLVNFALGLFSPTIHALRLHYVEFFGKFYSPGGVQYRPLAHWHPIPNPPT
jgi:V/A-type H+/Na+-transporting ATPase subunit I